MKRIYITMNILLILAVILVNTLISIKGLNGNTVGGISDKYDTLFAPAGYAFSIWSFIYLGLIVSGYYQVRMVVTGSEKSGAIEQVGPWLSVANLANILWLWAWLNEYTGTSLVLMLIILCSLLYIIVRLNIGRGNATSMEKGAFWWPVSLYAGWITVATIANVAALLVKLEWNLPFDPVAWTVLMILVALLINGFLLITRNLRVFAAVAIWAFVAISVRHWGTIPAIQWTALISAGVLATFIIGLIIRKLITIKQKVIL